MLCIILSEWQLCHHGPTHHVVLYLVGLTSNFMSRKGKNRREYSVRMCFAKRTLRYAWHKGEKGDDFESNQANVTFNQIQDNQSL